jgi:hypothetical protein
MSVTKGRASIPCRCPPKMAGRSDCRLRGKTIERREKRCVLQTHMPCIHPLQMPSKKWLAAQTADWKVKVHLMINIKREEALNIIGMDGILLVLCSYIDNMPYVVAEAAVPPPPLHELIIDH